MPYIDRDAFIKEQRELYCKDCTRRFGVKNGKLKEIYQIGEAPCRSCELNDALDDLDDYPEADVAPVVHAHWERLDKPKCKRDWYRCTNCGGVRSRDYDDEQSISEILPYCNCGARMDEKENEK